MATFIAILFAGALLAGFIGSLTGLGGGVIIVPLLTIGFGVDIRYAIGTSLIAVIFGFVLLYSAAASFQKRKENMNISSSIQRKFSTIPTLKVNLPDSDRYTSS